MKFINSFGFVFLFSTAIIAQDLQVSTSSGTQKYMYGTADSESVRLYENDGSLIVQGSYTTPDPSDESIRVYPKMSGSFILRENVANFIIYDSFGRTVVPISNSTQSEGGESMSELAMDSKGKTTVIYNPKIISGNRIGSRARVLDVNNVARSIYDSNDRQIRTVRVAETGQYIAIATAKDGTDDEVVVLDRYGNEIRRFSIDQEVAGLNLYGSGSTLTVFSSGRALVYNVMSGKRLGSTSFRSNVLFANYSGSDQSIVALTGNLNGTVVTNIEIHVINVGLRKIARQNYSSTIEVSNLDNISLEREGRYRYRLSGMSSDLNVSANF